MPLSKLWWAKPTDTNSSWLEPIATQLVDYIWGSFAVWMHQILMYMILFNITCMNSDILTPGLSPGILSFRRKTSKSRKFSSLNFLVGRWMRAISFSPIKSLAKYHTTTWVWWIKKTVAISMLTLWDLNHQHSDSQNSQYELGVRPQSLGDIYVLYSHDNAQQYMYM